MIVAANRSLFEGWTYPHCPQVLELEKCINDNYNEDERAGSNNFSGFLICQKECTLVGEQL